MERLKTLRKVIWITAVLFFIELAILAFMLLPMTTFLWLSLAVVAILGLYLARLAFVLLGELENKVRSDNK